MNVSTLAPAVSQRQQFTFQFQKFMPPMPGCYALTTFDGTVLYVGLSVNLQSRFGQHRSNPAKCVVTPHGKAFWFYFLPLPEAQLNLVERTWLNAHESVHGAKPFFNKIASPLY